MSTEETPRDMLASAAARGDLERIRNLLAEGVPIDADDGVRPLHDAVEMGELESLRLLLHHGSNIESIFQTLTPLAHAVDVACDAVNQGFDLRTEAIGILLKAGANPEPGINMALKYGCGQLAEAIRRYSRQQ